MCKAIDGMRAEARAEGREKSREDAIRAFVKYYLENGTSKEFICCLLQKVFSVESETAQKYFAE